MSNLPADAAPGNEIAGPGAPVTGAERITAIDTLRGIAVLGILVMNIYAFAMPFHAYSNPLVMGGLEWYNLGTWFFTHILFDQKFMTIFSLLFGGGMILMWQRAEAKGVKFGRIYYRRSFWLLLIGAIHGYLIWFGDILFHYALMGMFIYLFRKMRPRTLIIIAVCMLPVALLFSYGGAVYIHSIQGEIVEIEELIAAGEELTEAQSESKTAWDDLQPIMAPTDEDLQNDLEIGRGGYVGIFMHRLPFVLSMQIQTTFAFMIWRVGGLMLLGMAMMKLGILSGNREPAVYKKMMLVGYGLGLPLAAFSAVDLYAHEFDSLYFFQIGMIPNYVASILVAFGHIGIVMLIVKANACANLMARFSAVGRMALTNYLMHSVILTTIFYGYGIGLYGDIPRLAQMGFVAAVLGLQLYVSPIWLGKFRFGPVEWLWRSLTYWQRQPMRR